MRHTIALGLLAVAACGGEGDQASAQRGQGGPGKGRGPGGKPEQPPVPVAVTTAEVGTISSYYSATATLEADKEAEILARVSGTVTFELRPGNLFVSGTDSPYSLLAATRGVYGESAGEWTAADALGYSKVLSLTGSLQTRAAES